MRHLPSISRRATLLGLSGAMLFGRTRLAVAEVPGDARLVVVILRGALDGLYAVQPYGDAALRELRAPLVLPEPGQEGGLLDLGGHFGLHPAMPKFAAMYAANQAMVLHAVAGATRSRSHFDAQDSLESGADHRLSSGWLNRALEAMPEAGRARRGLALGTDVPLLIRGSVPVGAHALRGARPPGSELLATLARLNAADPVLGPAFNEGLRARGFSAEVLGGLEPPPRGANGFAALAEAGGRLLASADGPRVAAMELGGWDTHLAQPNLLPPRLAELDNGLETLRQGLGDAWPHTAVLVVTEFGRTVRVNGTNGTDHGTGTVALLAGGAVRGGRVLANWPGLTDLFENRDLAPTRDLRAVAKALLAQHLKLPDEAVAKAFPGSEAIRPEGGLLR
ncbi:DUF1501 domain-containing protein [Rhodovarius crocodyli]|uniref:DUF1501 domain-containing protein n=1 Tax=Rhodovarius crocodyli TaxID=1979269 RepID=A0A437MPE3_9PROT|nr:DUF1501 domain-containing protein [Rhodovarius crocodyli]RVT99522.1 DUF1501 domain-containing protein [Rhodovarius crocodyli]